MLTRFEPDLKLRRNPASGVGAFRGGEPSWLQLVGLGVHLLVINQLAEQGIEVRAVTYGTGDVPGAYTRGNGIKGTSKLVGHPPRGVILGATFTGPDVQELLHSATIAIVGEVPLETLWHAVPSFPTVSEVWLRLLEGYGL